MLCIEHCSDIGNKEYDIYAQNQRTQVTNSYKAPSTLWFWCATATYYFQCRV